MPGVAPASAITCPSFSVLQREIRVFGSLHGLRAFFAWAFSWVAAPPRRTTTCSEYFDGVPAGEMVNGVQCQDVQKLTYAGRFLRRMHSNGSISTCPRRHARVSPSCTACLRQAGGWSSPVR